MEPTPEISGRVILVPTPIGNMGDITLRALEILRSADRIACEDTRHSGQLLAHHGISGKPLVSLHEHNEARRAPDLIAAARAGETIAVISDAGMPGISDPGYRLVQACIESGTPLEVLPGPSAVITALIGSGFPCHAFRFGGFLSVKSGKRRSALTAALESGETGIFFESPHRIVSTLGNSNGGESPRPRLRGTRVDEEIRDLSPRHRGGGAGAFPSASAEGGDRVAGSRAGLRPFGRREHVPAFPLADMSASGKTPTCRCSPDRRNLAVLVDIDRSHGFLSGDELRDHFRLQQHQRGGPDFRERGLRCDHPDSVAGLRRHRRRRRRGG